jgi:hypothetical protein
MSLVCIPLFLRWGISMKGSHPVHNSRRVIAFTSGKQRSVIATDAIKPMAAIVYGVISGTDGK